MWGMDVSVCVYVIMCNVFLIPIFTNNFCLFFALYRLKTFPMEKIDEQKTEMELS